MRYRRRFSRRRRSRRRRGRGRRKLYNRYSMRVGRRK